MRKSLKTKLKQLWFPVAFRLPEPEFTKDQLDLLEELIQLIQPTLSQQEQTNRDERIGMAHFLIDLGTGIWRIRRKIEGLSRMPKEIKDALYSLESTWASMAEGGVEIIDHTGAIPLKNEAKIIEVREIPNLTRDQVIETIKPTIMLKGEVIQLGEVVMGRAVSPVHSAASVNPEFDAPPAIVLETALDQTDELKSAEPEEFEAMPPLLTKDEDSPPDDGANGSDDAVPDEGAGDVEEMEAPEEFKETAEVTETPEGEQASNTIEPAEIAGAEELTGETETTKTAETTEIIDAEPPADALLDEAEAKPKKKRAARKLKAGADANVVDAPKPKKTRRKKATDGTTEVNDAD
ncbi:MAG: hypothetical protein LBS45_01460 [Synergistaceae bacterium]|nr:hypothetical protein [Synergistaceae bacterium]